jgi:hypothetical protein
MIYHSHIYPHKKDWLHIFHTTHTYENAPFTVSMMETGYGLNNDRNIFFEYVETFLDFYVETGYDTAD